AAASPEGISALPIWCKRAIAREIWDNLPVWFMYISTVGLLHFMVANVPTSEYEKIGHSMASYAATAVFPMFWVLLVYTLRVRDSRRLTAQWGMRRYLIPVAMAAALPAIYYWYQLVPGFRHELDLPSLVRLFEYMQLTWIALFIVHCAVKQRLAGLAFFFGVGWLYGLVLENGGIMMRYFFEPGYSFYLWKLPAPFATMMGWCLAFYACIWMTEFLIERFPTLRGSAVIAALTTTAIAISWDLQMDPLASLSGVFWKWNDLLPNWFLSVPFVNYVAWFSAFMPFAYIYHHVVMDDWVTPRERNWRVFKQLPNVVVWAGILFFGIMFVAEMGFDGPAYRVLDQFLTHVIPYGT
ncbi:hypothetical protein KDL45_14625, partial [bacterium]|nr:hypothetical protein [bacterium]